MTPTPRLLRCNTLSLLTAAAMLVTLTACGGSEGSDNSPDTTSQTKSQSPGARDGAKIPGGFPDGVPMPKYNSVSSASQLTDTAWRLMLVVDIDADDSLDNYATQLRDAGFEVQVSDPNVSGKSPTMDIDAVIRPPVITLQVMTNEE
ncbi:hypothetical protein V5R04_08930 [Jonesiaceae bacterium BS-20]|uniref:Uncharacterized protein n=1 Tax=Jonesiaceae bacterium BS-20 TaxID=3120821 RepID=A0AAU7DTK5_9MICO